MADYETDGSSALAPKDPYREIKDSERSSIRPQLGVIEGGGKGDGKPIGDLRDAAKSTGNTAEQSASVANPISSTGGGISTGQAAEAIRSNVKGPDLGSIAKTAKGKGSLNTKGPLVTIIALLIFISGLIIGGQTMMPFAAAARIVEEFNSMRTVMSKRSDVLIRYQLDTSRYRSPTTKTIFGAEKFKLSNNQIAKLKTQGIDTLEVDVGGQRIRLLVQYGGFGAQPILTNTDMGRFNANDLTAALEEALPDSRVHFTDAISINQAFNDNQFRNTYQASSKTWKGNFAGWYDSLATKNLNRIGNFLRRMFAGFQNTNDLAANEADFRDRARLGVTSTDAGSNTSRLDGTNDDGTEQRSESSSGSTSGDQTPAEKQATLRSRATNAASTAPTLGCAVYAATGNIFALVAVQQALQMISLAAGFLESTDKVRAEYGDASPMVYYTNALTAPGSKSAMESWGMRTLFGDRAGPDTRVKLANSESLLSDVKFMGQGQYSAESFVNCAYARVAAGVGSIVIDLVSVATGSIGSFVKSIVGAIVRNVLTGIVFSSVIDLIVENATEMLIAKYLQDFVGEDLGNAIASGSNKYLSVNHQGGGGTPGGTAAVLDFKRETEATLAEDARYDRETKSPFDTSSRHTFLGSLFYRTVPLAHSSSSVASVAASMSSLLRSSLTSLLPSASAAEETWLLTQQGDCPMSESVGVYATPFCDPYYVSDLSTIDMDPADVYQQVQELNSKNEFCFDNDEVSEDCYKREAKFGIAPSEPLNAVAKSIVDTRPSAVGSTAGPSPITKCERTHWYTPKNGGPSTYTHSTWRYSIPTNFKVIEPYVDEDPEPAGNCILDPELDENSNPIINPNSNLGAFIIFCGQRPSPWGAADANIAYQIRDTAVGAGTNFNGILGTIIRNAPITGDMADIAEAAADAKNAPWIGGGICINSSTNPDWGEFKYYQRYVEDQRWLVASGLIDTSSVEDVVGAYYDQYPLDNSYEGILARMSGMTKDDVIATLDLIDYMTFLAQYDPTDFYPIPTQRNQISLADQVPSVIIADHSTSPTAYLLIYADTRTRSHVA